MSNPQPEPSMEEILASIRRIISEDGEEEETPASPEKASSAPPAPEPPSRTDIFKKTEKPAARQEPAETPPEPLRSERKKQTEDVEMIKQNVAEAMDTTEEAMLAETTAAAASKAFQDLSQSVRVSRSEGGRTLEDIVTDMLRPLVKEWLDANLPAIVEEKVEEEVQRVARRRR